jgi:hypothetical protein
MLQQAGRYNDLSPKLIEKINNRIDSFGRKVRYKFEISNPDPHPDNKGQRIFPFLYTLDPVTFNIIDNEEDRKDKQKLKRIGIVESLKENGEPDRFRVIRIAQREAGVRVLDMEKPEDREDAFYLELHPKLTGGLFADKDKRAIVSRIDESALATEQRDLRKAKNKASDVAVNMSDKEVVEFADAMSGGNNVEWDSTQDPLVLRNKIEELAETQPVYFNELVESKNIEYQAVIKQAMNKGHIIFDPTGYSFKWTTNNISFAILQPQVGKNEVQLLAEIFQAGDVKQKALYQKIKSIVSGKEKEATA